MKEIISNFANKHKNSKFYISYCDFEDFDAYADIEFQASSSIYLQQTR